jgi:uncharacterized protein YpmB
MLTCTTGLNTSMGHLNDYISRVITNTTNKISNVFVYLTYTTFKHAYKVRQFFKRDLKDDVKLEHVMNYDTFNIYYYTITHKNNQYTFHYLVPNVLKQDEVNKLTNGLIKNTKSHIQEKDNNKRKVLHASFVTENDDMLCEITEDLQLFKYYFDMGTKKKDMLLWKDLLHIIEKKYNKTIDKCSTYLYIILNDEDLTEKTLLLSGLLLEHVRF